MSDSSYDAGFSASGVGQPSPDAVVSRYDKFFRRGGVGRRLLRRMLEGEHTWGELEIWSSRYGYTNYCLVVYPPGATAADRIRFRAMRSWPPIGLLLSVFSTVLSGQVLPTPATVAVAVMGYVLGALLLARVAGPRRRLIRTLQTCRGDADAGLLDRGPQELLDGVVALLLESERQLAVGVSDAVGHEANWGAAWRLLGAVSTHRS